MVRIMRGNYLTAIEIINITHQCTTNLPTLRENDDAKTFNAVYRKNRSKKCKHDLFQLQCVTCKIYCDHNTNKYNCKVCASHRFCKHNVLKRKCKVCSPHVCCAHQKIKTSCKVCTPYKCKHGNRSHSCIECKLHFCAHNRSKYKCKECKGSSICNHGNVRSVCKKCKGGSICEHDHIRSRCKKCKNDTTPHKRKRAPVKSYELTNSNKKRKFT